MENYIFFALAIAVIVVVFLLIKKITGCIIKSVILLIVAGLLVLAYFNYVKVDETNNQETTEQTSDDI